MIGFKNSTILLPDNNIAADKLYFVLKHELVHFKRKDLWYKSLVILTSAIHWFNPLMPLISKNVHVLCEVSCDDEIVKNTDISTRCQYSETIVDLIKNHSKQTTLLSTSFNGGKKGMKKRITSIMDTSKKSLAACWYCWFF